MKKPTWKKMLVAVGGLTLIVSGAVMAMGPGGWDEGRGSRMLAYLSDELALTDAQREQVTATFETVAAERAADRERLQKLRDQLPALERSFDAGAVQLIADEIGAITTRGVYSRVSTQSQVYQLLTDEQRQLLDEHRAERMENRGSYRGSHHRGKGGR